MVMSIFDSGASIWTLQAFVQLPLVWQRLNLCYKEPFYSRRLESPQVLEYTPQLVDVKGKLSVTLKLMIPFGSVKLWMNSPSTMTI